MKTNSDFWLGVGIATLFFGLLADMSADKNYVISLMLFFGSMISAITLMYRVIN